MELPLACRIQSIVYKIIFYEFQRFYLYLVVLGANSNNPYVYLKSKVFSQYEYQMYKSECLRWVSGNQRTAY